MANLPLHNSMVKRYETISGTHNYVFGFTYKKNIYACVCENFTDLASVTCLDKASRNGGSSLRFKPNTGIKNLLFTLASRSAVVCSAEFFDGQMQGFKGNRGELFETLVFEFFGGVQNTVKNADFTSGGDGVINGVDYQVKFEKATFCNEFSLSNLENKVR